MGDRDRLAFLGPTDVRERHPVPEPEWAARMWDQLWWVSLPWWRRLYWRLRGFRAPIQRFYDPEP